MERELAATAGVERLDGGDVSDGVLGGRTHAQGLGECRLVARRQGRALAFAALGAGYAIYGRLVSRWAGLDPDAVTPAVEMNDGVDYVPARHWTVLFGHHFASIAGAAPIVGPAIAVIWGWLPALLWVAVGTVFMGAVHDFSALVISLRNRGRSIGDVTASVISPRARTFFLQIDEGR